MASSSKVPATFAKKVIINSEVSKKYYTKIADIVDNYNSSTDKEKLVEMMSGYAMYTFCMLENTDLKNSIIAEYNVGLEKSTKYPEIESDDEKLRQKFMKNRKSEAFKIIPYELKKDENKKLSISSRATQMIEQSDSKDVVTEKYRRLLKNMHSRNFNPENVFLCVGSVSNTFAHRLEDEIDSIRKNIDFTDRKMGKGEFLDKLKKADIEYTNNTEYAFNYKDLQKYLNGLVKEEKDLDPALYLEAQKAEKLIKKIFPKQDVSIDFMNQFSKCLNYKKNADLFFNMKAYSDDGLMLYQKSIIEECEKKQIDPYESGKLEYKIALVNDEFALSNGEKSYRIIKYRNDAYKKYAEFNDSIVRSKSYQKNLASYTKTFDEDLVYDKIGEIAKKENREFLSDFKIHTFISEGQVSVMHKKANDTNDFIVRNGIKNVDITNNPFMKQIAYRYIPFDSTTINTKAERQENESILKGLQKNCEQNINKYPSYEEFEKKNDLNRCVENSIKNKGEI